MKTIKEIRKEYGLDNAFFAKIFGYSGVKSYNKSAGKSKIERLVCEFEEIVVEKKKSDASRKYEGRCTAVAVGPEPVACSCGGRGWVVSFDEVGFLDVGCSVDYKCVDCGAIQTISYDKM